MEVVFLLGIEPVQPLLIVNLILMMEHREEVNEVAGQFPLIAKRI